MKTGQFAVNRAEGTDCGSGLEFRRLNLVAGWIGSFALSAAAASATTLNAIYDQSFGPARLGALLAILLGFHVLRFRRIIIGRGALTYLFFLGYMCVSALWTPNVDIAANTLLPGLNVLLVLMLFGSLLRYHRQGSVVWGVLLGFLSGAVTYTLNFGFPFVRPLEFSYNAIAGMYLFGLFGILVWGWQTKQLFLCSLLAMIVMVLIAATTSIKTNLGILLGASAAAITYCGVVARVLMRSAIGIAILGLLVGYALVTSDTLFSRVEDGVVRIEAGAQILTTREDNSQGTSFNDRKYWQRVGLAGWTANPIFGSGVEAFRANVGTTSHSTPIDLLYNFGLIGFALFYSLFAQVFWRLYCARKAKLGALPVLVLSGAICYLFMSLSEPLHYSVFFAIFVAISSALLRKHSNYSAANSQPE